MFSKQEHLNPTDLLLQCIWYNKIEYDEYNKLETASSNAEPYLKIHKKRVQRGILLIHGFSSSPAEIKEYGEHLLEMKNYY